MADSSAIEWTDATWNPVTGCDRVSPGCAHCYALEYAGRLKAMGQPKYQRDGDPKTSGPGFGVTLHPGELEAPLRWRKPRRVFVNSMSDLFHEQVTPSFVAHVFAVMSIAEQHTFQVLTKRPHLMKACLTWPMFWLELNAERMRRGYSVLPGGMSDDWPSGASTLPNVWLGVSIENRRFVDRADLLRETPAAVRFVSAEPLLGPLVDWMVCSTCSLEGEDPHCEECEGVYEWPLQGGLDLTDIDWLIVGGESGPRHRPIKPEWVRGLRDLAQLYETAFFFKQWGGRTPKAGGRELDGRLWDEMPVAALRETDRNNPAAESGRKEEQ